MIEIPGDSLINHTWTDCIFLCGGDITDVAIKWSFVCDSKRAGRSDWADRGFKYRIRFWLNKLIKRMTFPCELINSKNPDMYEQ